MNEKPTSAAYINAQYFNEYEVVRVVNMNADILMNKRIYTFIQKIDDTARNIEHLPASGAFIILVQGTDNEMPTTIDACTKVAVGGAGTVAALGSQAGSGATWNAVTLTISSTASNFQIAHSLAGTTGEFYITIVGVI